MLNSPKIAIIVVNYNGLSSLGKLFIESISSYVAEAERCKYADVWFVDNGSSDDSIKIVKKKFRDKLGYITYETNLGYGNACNLAYWYLERKGYYYEYYTFANNDIVLFERSLCKLIKYLHELREVFPQGFIGVPILVNGYSGILDGNYYFDTSGATRPLTFFVKQPELLLKLMRGAPLPVSYADGALIIFPRTVLKKLRRPFDERLYLYYEDVDICLRAWSMGIPSLLLPIIIGKHYRSTTTKRFPGLLTYLMFRNRFYIVFKYIGLKGFIYSLASHIFYPLRRIDVTYFEQYSIKMPELPLTKTINMLQIKKWNYLARILARALIDALVLKAERKIDTNKGSLPIITLPITALLSSKRLIVTLQQKFYKLFKIHIRTAEEKITH